MKLSDGAEMISVIDKTDQVESLLKNLLSEQGTAPLNLDEVRVDPKWSAKIPATFAIRRKILPLCCLDGIVQIAVAHEIDPTIEHALSGYLGCPFVTLQVEPTSLQRAIARIYGSLASNFHADKQTLAERGRTERIRFKYDSLIEGEAASTRFHLKTGDVLVVE